MHLSGSVGVSLALVVPSVLGVLYLLLWQSYVLRCATQQESFWGLTLLTVLKPFLTNIKKYSVIEESQRKLTWDIYHVSSAIPPRNLIVRGCFVLEMVSFRLEVVTSSIQLAIVSGQVTTIYVHGYIQDQDQDHDHDHNRDHDHERDHDPDDDHDDDPDHMYCVILCVLLIMTIIIHP